MDFIPALDSSMQYHLGGYIAIIMSPCTPYTYSYRYPDYIRYNIHSYLVAIVSYKYIYAQNPAKVFANCKAIY